MTQLQTSPSRASRRTVPFLLLALMALQFAAAAPRAQAAPIVVNSVNLETKKVIGTIAGAAFTTDITKISVTPLTRLTPLIPDGEACAILDLELAPIQVALLGLHVDTSPICLRITAIEGGGLLGDLLCGLAGIGDLPATQIPALQSELVRYLNAALSHDPPGQGGGGNDSVCTGECEILEVVLGPLDLTLLGLRVELDDCDDGPVQICVSATQSEGLLGSLLCGLAQAQLPRLSLADITQLVTTALGFLADDVLTPQETAYLRGLLGRLLR